MRRVLIGSPIRQDREILRQFLISLKDLDTQDLAVDYAFIDDNEDESSSDLLRSFRGSGDVYLLPGYPDRPAYNRNEHTHSWQEHLVWRVAAYKDQILDFARHAGYDGVFLVDSDLVLHPKTLKQLISANVDIISEVFWTRWAPNEPELPQVWLRDTYTLHHQERWEKLSSLEMERRRQHFLSTLRHPGIYEVGGLGACTLISRRALEVGVSFAEVRNVSFWGEDRHFGVRAAALGLRLYVDTHYPCLHLYRKKDLERVDEYRTSFSRMQLEAEAAQLVREVITHSGDGSLVYVLWVQPRLIEPLTAHVEGTYVVCDITQQDSWHLRAFRAVLLRRMDTWEIANLESMPSEPVYWDKIPYLRKARNSCVILSVLIRPGMEAHLPVLLRRVAAWIDGAVIVVGERTGQAVERLCREHLSGLPLRIVPLSDIDGVSEQETRRKQWHATLQMNPDWVCALDAGDVPDEAGVQEIRALVEQSGHDVVAFRVSDAGYRPVLARPSPEVVRSWLEQPSCDGLLPKDIWKHNVKTTHLRVHRMGNLVASAGVTGTIARGHREVPRALRALQGKKPQIVMLSSIDWDYLWQRPQQLACQFADMGIQTVYVQAAGSHLILSETSGMANLESRVAAWLDSSLERKNGVVVCRPLRFLSTDQGTKLDVVELWVRHLIRRLALDQPIFWIVGWAWGNWSHVLRKFGFMVYDSVDDLSGFTWVTPDLLRAEGSLLRHADVVFAVSPRLARLHAYRHPRVHLLPNGVNLEQFRLGTNFPIKRRWLSRVAGYVGVLAEWVDVGLIASVARLMPDWTFLLVGPAEGADLTPIQGIPNVVLTGRVPYSEIPRWMAQFDVAMVPFRMDHALLASADAIKVYEYMAAGLPIVSTPWGNIEAMEEMITIASDATAFAQALEVSLRYRQEEHVARRREFARANSWRVRATVGLALATAYKAARAGDHSLARAVLDSALEDVPASNDMRLELLAGLVGVGAPEAVVGKASGTVLEAQRLLQRLVERGSKEQAALLSRYLVSAYPEDPDNHFNNAVVEMELGEPLNALEHLAWLLHSQRDIQALPYMASAVELAGENELARQWAELADKVVEGPCSDLWDRVDELLVETSRLLDKRKRVEKQ